MIRCGIDNLHLIHDVLAGKRLGLMTNPTGVNAELRSTIDILHEEYSLTALFACAAISRPARISRPCPIRRQA